MRAKEFIVEYDRSKTAQALGDKLISAGLKDHLAGQTLKLTPLPNNPNETVNKILAAIEDRDPTPNKEYTQWMARMYANGGVKLEDLNRNNTIGIYDLGKKRRLIQPEDADINRFKTYKDFEDVVLSKYDPNKIEKQEKKEVNKGNAKLYFENDQVRIIIPKDEQAACYYGQGTRWCTAATRGRNAFNEYNEEGPLYIILFKKSPVKWQFHFPEAQFMNEADEELNSDQIKTVAQYFPDKLWKIALPHAGEVIQFMHDPDERSQMIAVKSDSSTIQYIKDPSEKVQLAAVRRDYGYGDDTIGFIANPSELVQLASVKSNPSSILSIRRPSEKIQLVAMKHLRHPKAIIDYVSSQDITERVLKAAGITPDEYQEHLKSHGYI
jgi:hypothetical protein